MKRLQGKIAVVTGASRGGGRGMALVLGEEGAIVYITARSVHGSSSPDHYPGTVYKTAEEVTARGGQGIPVQCDHSVDTEIEWLFERVKRQHGKLDILVNNAWGGYENYINHASFGAPFWEAPIDRFDKMLAVGVRSHLVTTRFALPLMMPQGAGLIINTTYDVGAGHLGNVFYYTAKHAINRMTESMAHTLRTQGHNIAAIALSPGWMNTEAMEQTPEALAEMESVEYSGRAIVALATDPNVMKKTGRVLRTRDLGREYKFVDIDGRQPPI